MNKFIVSSNEFTEKNIPWFGNKFLTGNGYMGLRGTMEEYTKEQMCAINLAGIYDRVGDSWRESVNAPNPLYTYIVADGKKYSLPEKVADKHAQILDFKNAIQKRETVWKTDKGNVFVTCERFTSMANQHVIAMKYTVKAEYMCDLEIITGIDGDVWDINGPHLVDYKLEYADGIKTVTAVTGEKAISVKVQECAYHNGKSSISKDDKSILENISITLEKDKEFTLEKICLVSTSVDDNVCNDNIKELSYSEEKEKHIKAWEKIWDISEVEIDGDSDAEFALNYSIYHLNCIAPRNLDGKSIPARGLSGQVYKGAVFWDTEMFMLDYFIHTEPEVAKTLLKYRIDTIEGARIKAKEYNLDGAYYAWESQEGGYEGCSDYNIVDVFTKRPMRTYFRDKQYHVSAAIVYGFMKYINATGDYDILKDGGLEVIIECARMYYSLLLKKVNGTKYEIHDVVGPDEYHERVDNNTYTNRMVKFVFETAAFMADYAQQNGIASDYDLQELKEKMTDAAENMFIHQPNEEGVIEQFDGYFKLEDASIETVRSRLLDPKEYWGGANGVAAHTQVLKQADVVAMLSMFKDDYDTEIMRKNWEYYEPRTEHGSSLSACMYSLLSCYTGNPDNAYSLFMKSANADLLPAGKEWLGLIYIGGTHPASEGGAWIVAIKGFAGMSIKDGELVFNPKLPEKWNSMKFKVMYIGKIYSVRVDKNGVEIL